MRDPSLGSADVLGQFIEVVGDANLTLPLAPFPGRVTVANGYKTEHYR
jgi:hypothetical protein